MCAGDYQKASFSFKGEDAFHAWKKSTPNIRTWVKRYVDTGEIKKEDGDGESAWRTDRHNKYRWYTILYSAKFQAYLIEIREGHYENLITGEKSVKYNGIISGSLISNYYGGTNWQDLSFEQLQEELSNIEAGLKIDLDKIKIDNLEPSITIEMPFKVKDFIDKNIVSYLNKPFNRYSQGKNGKAIGRYIDLSDLTTVKIYDKSEVLELNENLLRFELRYKKMTVLNKIGIHFLSDLRDRTKVQGVLEILTSYFKRVLIYDPEINRKDASLTDTQRSMLISGRSFEYWEDLKAALPNGTYYSRLNDFRSLSKKYGSNIQDVIIAKIVDKWNFLMKDTICNDLPCVNYSDLERFTSTVRCKSLQDKEINNDNCINIKLIKMGNTEQLFTAPGKSKKQIARERREKDQAIINGFMCKLKTTLAKIAA